MRKLPKHSISIRLAENGVIVEIGCKTFVSEDVDKAMCEVTSFIKDEETELTKKYLDGQPVECGQDCEATSPPLQARL